jgi:hypothetical protein
MTPEDDNQEPLEDALPCPECGGPLRLYWTIRQMAHLPEMRTFKCVGCSELFTDDGDPSHPLIRLRKL